MVQFDSFEDIIRQSGLDDALKYSIVTQSQAHDEEIEALFTTELDESDLTDLTIIDL